MTTVMIHRQLSSVRYLALLLVAASLSIIVATASLTLPAHAANQSQDDAQITLSPTNQTLDITAGHTYQGSFTIFNSGKEPLDFTVYAAPYQVRNEQYDPTFNKNTNRTQIARWVQFAQTDYSVEPGKQVAVNYTVVTPESIPDGGQYAALFAQTKAQKTGSIMSQKRVGMLLYAHATGKTITRGESLAPRLGFWQNATSFTFEQKIKNSGNTDFPAKIKLSVSDMFGNEKYTQSKQNVILPDTTRAITMEWKNAPPLALMNVVSSVTILGKTTQYKHTVLFATPLAVIVATIVLLLIIGGGVYAVKKRLSRPTLRKR